MKPLWGHKHFMPWVSIVKKICVSLLDLLLDSPSVCCADHLEAPGGTNCRGSHLLCSLLAVSGHWEGLMNPGYRFECRKGPPTYKSLMLCDTLPFTKHPGHTFQVAGPELACSRSRDGKTKISLQAWGENTKALGAVRRQRSPRQETLPSHQGRWVLKRVL